MATEPSGSPFQRDVGFAGKLASMKREEAFAIVRERGGTPRRGVTRKTSVLVIGELGWPLLADGSPSKSLGMARAFGIPIASERDFLEWAGRAAADEQVRHHSADQLAALAGLPLAVIDQLTVFGLLDCREQRYGFRDLAAARQLAGLLDAGVALSSITRSLQEIRKWLPGAMLCNLRLYPSSSDGIVVELMSSQADRTGQFVLPVGETHDDADAIFEQAQWAEEAKDLEAAQRLYRKVMHLDAGDPTAAFNLGNLLRSIGRRVEAEAAYRAATRADPRFAEAWYNLADILDEQSQSERAIGCLERALDADPGYADAVFNLGLLHQRSERHADAASCWRRYLALDNASPWATRARRALKYCEMRIAQSA